LTLRQSLLILGSKGQGSQGDHSELVAPGCHLTNKTNYKNFVDDIKWQYIA